MRRGFTLIEMLVVLAVFAVVGLIASQLVSRTINNHAIMSERAARLVEVQRAMQILKRDVMQLTNRPIRDMLGDQIEPIRIGSDGLIEFSRMGWRNPLQQRRAELQRVAYIVEDGDLYRSYWSVLDRAQDSEPVVQKLLGDVEQVEFFALDAAGNEHTFWPLLGAFADDPNTRLVALIMRVEAAPFGIVERLWPVPSV
ncbi:MAG: type II secretion system minor pseudopilin GspJ [Gammaproteobacteria bacterium]|nr:type II secretion system minor pseudopilin GspJ [Gammaproteobacteria bacterium]